MSQPSRTSRAGLARTDLRHQARLRALAVAASAASTGWMAAALAEAGTPAEGARAGADPAGQGAGRTAAGVRRPALMSSAG